MSNRCGAKKRKKQNNGQINKWTILPCELVFYIAEFLDVASLGNLCMTCHSLHDRVVTSKTYKLYKIIYPKTFMRLDGEYGFIYMEIRFTATRDNFNFRPLIDLYHWLTVRLHENVPGRMVLMVAQSQYERTTLPKLQYICPNITSFKKTSEPNGRYDLVRITN
jgi:hypothetical protein